MQGKNNQTIRSSRLLNWLDRMILKCMHNAQPTLKFEAADFFLEIVNVWGKRNKVVTP